MGKVLSGALLGGVLAWGWPTAVLAQAGCLGPEGQCDSATCSIPGDCPIDPSANCGCDWADDIEGYPLGLMPEENGWEGWMDEGVPDPAVRGMVSDEQNHTPGGSKSIKIHDVGTDQVHRFYGEGVYYNPSFPDGGGGVSDGVGYDTDVNDYWVIEAWIFIPLEHTGHSMFILNSDYDGTQDGTQWHVQIIFDGDLGETLDYHVTENTLDLVKGAWVRLEVDINLDTDECIIWYDEGFLAGYRWGQDSGSYIPHQVMFLGNLDLYNRVDPAGGAWYVDDVSVRAAEPPPCLPPEVECFPQRTFDVVEDGELVRCADYMWRVTNANREGDLDTFYLDIEAGDGGVTTTNDCRGGSASTTAITPPDNWSVVKCTNWNSGHAVFKFTADDPMYDIPVGESVTGGLTVDPNLSVEVDAAGTGATVPGLSVLISSAQSCNNEAYERCATNDYSFGPTTNGQWAIVQSCAGYINIPATSAWAKALLVILLVGGGTLLVLRSRRPVTA